MPLTETQFNSLKEQLQKKKSSLGEQNYNEFISASQGLRKPEQPVETSNVPFPATGQETGIQAGLKATGNLPVSTFQFGKNIAEAVTSPVETGKGIFNLLVGGGGQIQNLLSKGVEKITGVKDFGKFENEPAQQTFNAVVSSLNQRYGSLEAAQKTAIEDPFGVGADIIGALSGTKAVGVINDINDIAKTSIAAKVANKFDDVAISQMQKALNLNPSDIRKIKQPNIAGIDPANWLLERGFKGSQENIVSKLDDYRFNSKAQVDNGLKAIEEFVPATDAIPAQKTLQVLKNTFEGTVGNEPLVKSIDDLLAKDSYSLTELNDIKRLADNELNIFAKTGVLKESATAKGLNNVRDELKTLIENKAAENGFDSVKQLNKETQVSFEISKALKKRLDVESKLPNLGLRDAILATGGFATGGPLAAMGLVISKKVLESPQFRTYLANKLKALPIEQSNKLEEAIKQRRYVDVIQYLAPVVNEFENAQTTNQESESLLQQ